MYAFILLAVAVLLAMSMAFYLLPPDIAKSRFKGHAGFQDSVPGVSGSGIPRFSGANYSGYDTPTKIGARYFFPEPDYNEVTDQPLPAAMGHKADGGAPAYRNRVYAAAKKVGKQQGLTEAMIDELKPKGVD
ncbi:MAG: hypothetical protein V3U45_07970 [bacterium]